MDLRSLKAHRLIFNSMRKLCHKSRFAKSIFPVNQRRSYFNKIGNSKNRIKFSIAKFDYPILSQNQNFCSTHKKSANERKVIKTVPFDKMTIGIPKESFQDERRVAISPNSVMKLAKKGATVLVATGAGEGSNFTDEAYNKAGATICSQQKALSADVVLKVRAPSNEEISHLKDESTLFSFVFPAKNKQLVQKLEKKKTTLFAMDCIPRITTSQGYDALSSMSNVAGYKAVVEAAQHFGNFFSGQTTAAG
ncbi:hypothetical protein MHBO_004198, partial [Bonamia ostreae]